jgi:hypothetical protein
MPPAAETVNLLLLLREIWPGVSRFGDWNLAVWSLFVIWCLSFGAS